MLLHSLTNKSIWYGKRKEYLQSARDCRDTLINRRGLSADDEVIKRAIMFWVRRAKRAHNIALRREPIIDNFLCAQGLVKLYAEDVCRD